METANRFHFHFHFTFHVKRNFTFSSECVGSQAAAKMKEAGDIGPLAAELGGGAVPLLLDVTDDASVAAAAASVLATGSQLDALVNNAGVLLERKGTALASIVEPTLRVNLRGAVSVTAAFRPLIRDGGLIVNISSGAGTFVTGQLDPSVRARLEAMDAARLQEAIARLAAAAAASPTHQPDDTPIYGVSKAGLNYYTQLEARENPRLRVVACSPGFCRTAIAGADADYSRREPKEAALGADVVVKLLLGDLGRDSGRFYKECSKPGTSLEAARSKQEPWEPVQATIEAAWQSADAAVEVTIRGQAYVLDFAESRQRQKSDPSRSRAIKRVVSLS
ncbi:hypothetical protein EMIHUDRAFT_240561 [Emiliania huxleyi CCMP1516]|uniref:WWE domain-containing protein n=2 Tax=Emiliania huxleyi TaxID=2903 RepID=A0A0D3JEW4_EMIH1|nr:hypothetical protein EMIHUDRAFT_240561 [Emiliania huxleyi CCMP1516]EOD22049.1 hypothetical protein EMIHUDRAFT_240561 [Emiliania huxleyi CCMP1516]|eukprot:XP_005774478.1 hypothetical protein EMIHUDRAFT_240561 [Emiliania huxleyi CCMP1516]